MIKKIMIIVFAVVALGLSAYSVLAHGGPNLPIWQVNPVDKNCMGQLARMHAQDELKGTNGLPASFKESRHGGFGLGPDKGDTVHDTMHAFKAYCKGE